MATLTDDAAAEDAVIVNSPAQMDTVDVHLVELPTTVLASGRPRQVSRITMNRLRRIKSAPNNPAWLAAHSMARVVS